MGMTFNEWRHRHTAYDRKLNAARTPAEQRAVIEATALAAMQAAVQRNDRAFAEQVMRWAQTKRIVN